MKREIETKFFTFNQNNSGGYFIINDDVAVHLIIEARNAEEAISKMRSITEDYSEWCTCCGERWCSLFVDDDDGTEVPTVYGADVKTNKPSSWHSVSTIIYYYDDTKEKLYYE